MYPDTLADEGAPVRDHPAITRFDLGEVQNVVDDAQQRLSPKRCTLST
jgi:hypothetical protein